ncbi:MAG: hypothetical protein ACUZ9M_01095 [Candidatus Scalindua sp.]
MKILSTMLVTVTLLVIGLSFLSSGKNADKNVSKPSVKKVKSDEYYSQFKRRDFISERRENKRKKIDREKNVKQVDVGSYHADFMVYNRMNHDRLRYDDFR